MVKDKVIYDGAIRVVRREVQGVSYELSRGLYEASIAILNRELDHLVLINEYCAASDSHEWLVPTKALTQEGSMRGCAIAAAQEAGVVIGSDDFDTLIYYYPCINYDLCKHVIFYTKTLLFEKENVLSNKAKWFSFMEIKNMIKKGEIVDGKTMFVYYKLLEELK